MELKTKYIEDNAQINVYFNSENTSAKEILEALNNYEKLKAVFEKIDWELFKEQRNDIRSIRVEFELNGDPREASLEGILNLIDSLQDCAVDTLGIEERKVFDFIED